MHAKATTQFARPMIAAIELRLDERARDVYMAVTERLDVRTSLVRLKQLWYRMRRRDWGSRPLTAVATQVVDLANAGATEAEARRISMFIDDVIADVFCGKAHRSWNPLDLEEEDLDGQEDLLTMRRRVEGESIDLLREAAAIDRRHAAVQLERARYCERRLRELERAQ